MCKRKPKKCKVVAVRFHYKYETVQEKLRLTFAPHEVIVHKVEKPTTKKGEETKSVIFVEDLNYLQRLDPLEWKEQDHYRVLGISNLRHATPAQEIRNCYCKMVLKHHPDKRKGKKINSSEDYFMCITMAYKILSDEKKRRSYDSVDPTFDNSLPSFDKKDDFFKTFGYYFELNSRWSEKKSVPLLGGPEDTREQVNRFYNFWYDFKSWREFSYEDMHNKALYEDREERRHCEKLNKASRQQKKKAEMQRIRSLVDMAYKADPRIVKFKQEDYNRKNAGKLARKAAAQAKKEEEERLAREAKEAQEKLIAAEKSKAESEKKDREAEKKDREAQKKALRRQRKIFRDTCKAKNYYTEDENEIYARVEAVEKICAQLNMQQLRELNNKLKSDGADAFLKTMKDCSN